MADPADQTASYRVRETANEDQKRLKYAFDTGFLSDNHPPDTPDADGDDPVCPPPSSDSSESSGSGIKSDRLAGLAASLRVFSESMLRMELAEMEMRKAREALRWEAEKRRVESEASLTQMMLQTQLQVASFLSRACPSRKRKRSEQEDGSSTSEREGAMLLSLLLCNLV